MKLKTQLDIVKYSHWYKNFSARGRPRGLSNSIFNFNFLGLAVSEILGGSQIYIRGPCAPQRPPSGKILTCAQVLANVYITVTFQLRIAPFNALLTERSLYNRFFIERLRWPQPTQ